MTIHEAIERTDSLKFNTYSQSDKVDWLSRLDWSIKRHILDTHEGGAGASFSGYGDNTDVETVLLVPPPYDEVYLRWLEAQIDYHNGEYDRYNAAIVMYNMAFETYEKYYKQNHRPIGKGKRFLF